MKLLNVSLEMRAIRTICSKSPKISGLMLASVDESFFYFDATKEAFERIRSLVKSTGEIPTYTELCADPVISEDHRKLLSKKKKSAVTSEKDIIRLKSKMDAYRKLRGEYFMAEKVLKALKQEKIDPDALLEQISDDVANIRTKLTSHELLHFGKGNNSSAIIKDLLEGEEPDYIPTGFRAFDDRNGGFFPGSLVTIASTSGGGKSTLGNQLLINMSLLGYDTCIVPLEMTKKESTARILAERSGIDIVKILRKQLAKGERKKVTKSIKKYVQALKEKGSRYTIFEPEEDMTIEEILTLLKPYGHHVVIIDYINLLKGVDGEDSWRELSRVARFCKIFAKNNNMVVILIAQLKDDGKIKYSGGITEHSNNAWVWTYTDESRETGLIEIKQIKARNQDPFPFKLAHDYSVMRLRDIDDKEAKKMRTAEGDKKRQELDEFAADLTIDDDDID